MSKNKNIYRDLQSHLDKYPIGFPPTESGVEIKLLKLLFTPKEAEIATKLKIIPKSIRPIFRRSKKIIDSKDELKELLDNMAKKGAIYGKKKGKKIYYRNAMLIIGIYEFQVTRITKEFMEVMHQYIAEIFAKELLQTKIHQLRIIPIEKSISQKSKVYTYDNVINLIKNVKGEIGVAECVCRLGHDLLEKNCKLTDLRETCLVFEQTANYHISQGYARPIQKFEAIAILRKAEDAGLVLQSGNSKKLGFICTCCGCCCEGIRLLNNYPKPATLYSSTYQAIVCKDLCISCKACIKRCQIKAISIIDDKASVNLDRCIGCGLCVPKCPEKAINLVKKDKIKTPPRTHFRLMIRITRRKQGNWAAFKLIFNTIFSFKLYYILKKK